MLVGCLAQLLDKGNAPTASEPGAVLGSEGVGRYFGIALVDAVLPVVHLYSQREQKLVGAFTDRDGFQE